MKKPGFNVAGVGWKPEKQPAAKVSVDSNGEKKRISKREKRAKDPAKDIPDLALPGF